MAEMSGTSTPIPPPPDAPPTETPPSGLEHMRCAVARGPKPASMRKVPQGARTTVEFPPLPLPRTHKSSDIHVSKVMKGAYKSRTALHKLIGRWGGDIGDCDEVLGNRIDSPPHLTDKYSVPINTFGAQGASIHETL